MLPGPGGLVLAIEEIGKIMAATKPENNGTSALPADHIDADPAQAMQFLERWHGDAPPERFVGLTTLPNKRSAFSGISSLLRLIASSGLDELAYPAAPGAVRQSIYISAALLREKPPLGHRGGKKHVWSTPGLWADIDLRGGTLTDWPGVMDLAGICARAGIAPTMITRTGGGGGHFWWRTANALTADEAETYGRAVRLWLEAQCEAGLDHVEDSSRLMRLPGSIRQPKADEPVGKPALCTIESDLGASHRISLWRIEQLTRDHVRAWEDRTRQQRERAEWSEKLAEREVAEMLRDLDGGDTWASRWAMAGAVEEFNRTVSWDAILDAPDADPDVRWTKYGEPDSEGRQQWSRPGPGPKSPRSLVVGWSESPNVASLLSLDPSTKLRTLHDAGVPLTKLAVAAALHADGDVSRVLRGWLLTTGLGRTDV